MEKPRGNTTHKSRYTREMVACLKWGKHRPDGSNCSQQLLRLCQLFIYLQSTTPSRCLELSDSRIKQKFRMMRRFILGVIFCNCLFQHCFLFLVEHPELAHIPFGLNNKRQLSSRQQCLELAILESGRPREFSLFSLVNQLIHKT